ncbi:uncharacterized protein ACLA_028130 [Aspergillus clavatus NRRL 1]|uniref:Uncharacterized protein n=1 Tax=Aspergillus clavatus (strain ATCC 1007 / CBS 513.65 / DSM 816 / NCTC 3887 / NRRL 1 / QM 1276 / 107) TaxID=344612 RepID=A1CR17_ASPCL|nr:uncharacterized protein ACLA_028130 [Aspergillus clavatus NRRL 1]EAW08088.1 hypothetical protein ACLA_028130 [Aspergillus clavatus NRRL 1]
MVLFRLDGLYVEADRIDQELRIPPSVIELIWERIGMVDWHRHAQIVVPMQYCRSGGTLFSDDRTGRERHADSAFRRHDSNSLRSSDHQLGAGMSPLDDHCAQAYILTC